MLLNQEEKLNWDSLTMPQSAVSLLDFEHSDVIVPLTNAEVISWSLVGDVGSFGGLDTMSFVHDVPIFETAYSLEPTSLFDIAAPSRIPIPTFGYEFGTAVTGTSFQATVVDRTADIDVVFTHNSRGACYTIKFGIQRAVKYIRTVIRRISYALGHWVSQFAVLAYIQSRPRILLS